MAENKTKPTKVSVKEFMDSISDDGKRADARALVRLMESVTGEKPKMWGPSIIGFGSYHYQNPGGSEGDMPLACFSPRKGSIVVYGMTGLSDSAALLAKLGKHTVVGGCVHIKKLADVDAKTLESLVRKSVEAKQS